MLISTHKLAVLFTVMGAALSVVLAALAPAPAVAQEAYPSRAVKLVVPYPPGGTTDIVARMFAEQLGKELAQPVVIDNRPGGSTNIGAEAVARSKADGYTLLFGTNSQVFNPIFGPVPSFELKELEPVSPVSRVAFVVAAHPSAPFNTGAELMAAAKAAPGKYTMSSPQLDTYVELMIRRSGINILHIPYKGGAAATTDAISGQVNMVFALLPVLQQHIQANKLKALAVTSDKRLSALPDVATVRELGVDYDMSVWFGVLAPAGTPKPAVDRLAAATRKIMSSPEMVARVRAVGAEPAWSTPADFKAELARETALWQQTAKAMPNLIQK